MTFNPKIDGPCPYKNNLAAVMDGDFCKMCKRNVFDLSEMSDAERIAFLSSCDEEVCVSYTIPVRRLGVGIAAAAALLAPVPLAAQEVETAAMEDVEEFDYIIVGGIKDPKSTAQKELVEDKDIPELPVIEESVVELPDSPPAKNTANISA